MMSDMVCNLEFYCLVCGRRSLIKTSHGSIDNDLKNNSKCSDCDGDQIVTTVGFLR